MKRHVAVVLFTLMALSSCAQKEKAGGPCSYKTTNYPAVIVMIYEVDSTKSDMFVALDMFGEVDTMSYHSERQEYFSNKEMEDMNYKVGDTLTYKVMNITSGHCSPHIKVLTKERYTK